MSSSDISQSDIVICLKHYYISIKANKDCEFLQYYLINVPSNITFCFRILDWSSVGIVGVELSAESQKSLWKLFFREKKGSSERTRITAVMLFA